jgi:UDP-N-acetylglucosamine 2-epimerase
VLRVMTVVGTRPEIIRLSRVIAALDESFDHILVHTGQNYDYELNEVFFAQLGIRRPDHYLNSAASNAIGTIAQAMVAVDRLLEDVKPDAFLVLGDTNSALTVIAAKKRQIPIFHMEAGNRCYDARVPEEINRRIIDHLADINLPYSQIAREYLMREGISADQIIVTGSPMREVLEYYSGAIARSQVLADYELRSNEYFVVSAHREENVDSPERLKNLVALINAVAEKYSCPLVLSLHPRTRARLKGMNEKFHSQVQQHRPFGFLDYIQLQLHAKAVISDSGTITEESSILGFPAVNIREVHERPEGFESAAVMFVGLNASRTIEALELLQHQRARPDWLPAVVPDYSARDVSLKIVRIILSYTDFIRRRTWNRA